MQGTVRVHGADGKVLQSAEVKLEEVLRLRGLRPGDYVLTSEVEGDGPWEFSVQPGYEEVVIRDGDLRPVSKDSPIAGNQGLITTAPEGEAQESHRPISTVDPGGLGGDPGDPGAPATVDAPPVETSEPPVLPHEAPTSAVHDDGGQVRVGDDPAAFDPAQGVPEGAGSPLVAQPPQGNEMPPQLPQDDAVAAEGPEHPQTTTTPVSEGGNADEPANPEQQELLKDREVDLDSHDPEVQPQDPSEVQNPPVAGAVTDPQNPEA